MTSTLGEALCFVFFMGFMVGGMATLVLLGVMSDGHSTGD